MRAQRALKSGVLVRSERLGQELADPLGRDGVRLLAGLEVNVSDVHLAHQAPPDIAFTRGTGFIAVEHQSQAIADTQEQLLLLLRET